MTITSLAIFSRTDRGTDDLLFIKEFKSNNEPTTNMDIDSTLFESVLTETAKNSTNSIFAKQPQNSHHACITPHDCSIRHQSLLQAALEKLNNDIQFENNQRVTFGQGFRGAEYMWVGFLCLVDEFRFYGYITNTNVKIIVAVEDDLLPGSEMQIVRDSEVKKTLMSIHESYVDYVLNPFSDRHGRIKSRRFNTRMEQLASMQEM